MLISWILCAKDYVWALFTYFLSFLIITLKFYNIDIIPDTLSCVSCLNNRVTVTETACGWDEQALKLSGSSKNKSKVILDWEMKVYRMI